VTTNIHDICASTGLGHMGSKMVSNISSDGNSMVIFDMNFETAKGLASENVRAVVSVCLGQGQ
jgi:6-phosphogluconate dehydrogenase (decarboxylating)